MMSNSEDNDGVDEMKVFTEAFHKFDLNSDGELALSEFSQACQLLGFTYDEKTLGVGAVLIQLTLIHSMLIDLLPLR